MSTVQVMGLLAARKNMVRARKELERAKLMDTTYRGCNYAPNHDVSNQHGVFVYRGNEYTK